MKTSLLQPAHRHDATIVAPIAARDLRKRYESDSARFVVDGVSLCAERGEWVAVMGRSGCGKSTLLQMLGGLALPTSGTVEVGGVVITDLSESARARLRRSSVGYVFQRYNLIDELTAIDDVSLPLRLNGVPGRQARRRAAAMLEQLEMAGRAGARPAELSGGEQQRVAIARALIAEPRVVLADEPTGALDSGSATVVMELLRRSNATGQTIVMVTHDPASAACADRTLYMDDGRLSRTQVGSVDGS
jgi:putative ABC transport system ATP-binding protein